MARSGHDHGSGSCQNMDGWRCPGGKMENIRCQGKFPADTEVTGGWVKRYKGIVMEALLKAAQKYLVNGQSQGKINKRQEDRILFHFPVLIPSWCSSKGLRIKDWMASKKIDLCRKTLPFPAPLYSHLQNPLLDYVNYAVTSGSNSLRVSSALGSITRLMLVLADA